MESDCNTLEGKSGLSHYTFDVRFEIDFLVKKSTESRPSTLSTISKRELLKELICLGI